MTYVFTGVSLCRILSRDGVEGGFDLEWGEIGVAFDEAGDDAGDVRARETVSRQVAMAAAKPGSSNIDAGSG